MKIKLTILDRMMLMNNIVESFNTQNGTKKEIVMCQSASLALGLS